MEPELLDEELELLDEDEDDELDELLEDELEEELEEPPELDEPEDELEEELEELLEFEPAEAGFPELSPLPFSVISVLQPDTTAKKITITASLILRMMPPLISTEGIKQVVFLSRKRRLLRAK